MAGSRKKGGTKGLTSFNLGDLVLAKVKGFPAWPAKICKPEDFEKDPVPRKHFVYFFGTNEIGFVAPADIQVFTSETKNKLDARCRGKPFKFFAQAVKEICAAFDELPKKETSSTRVDEQLESGGEVLGGTMDGVGLDEEVETDKVSAVDKIVNEDCIVDKHHSPEHCETDDQDLKSSKLSHVIGSPSIMSSKRKHKIINGLQPKEESAVSPDSPFLSRKNTTMKEIDGTIAKHTGEGEKSLANGHKPKIPAAVVKKNTTTSTFQHHESDEKLKYQIKGNISGSSCKEIPSGRAKSELRTFSRKKGLGMTRHKESLEQTNKGSTDKGTSEKESELKLRLVLALGNPKLAAPVKRMKHAEIKLDVKASLGKGLKKDYSSDKAGRRLDNRNSAAFMKEKTVSEMQVDMLDLNDSGDEAALPVAKRRHRAMEAMTDSANLGLDDHKKERLTPGRKNEITSIQSDDPAPRMHKKRRAVRLFDDDEDEEPKTPVHGGVMRNMRVPSNVPDKAKTSEPRHGGKRSPESPACVDNRSSKQPAPEVLEAPTHSLEKRSKKEKVHALSKVVEAEIEHSSFKEEVKPSLVSPGKSPVERSNKEKAHAVSKGMESEIEQSSLKDVKPSLVSPGKSPINIFPSKPKADQQKSGKPQVKGSHEGAQRKAISASNRDTNSLSETSKLSQSQASHKSRLGSSGERLKSASRTIAQSSHVSTVAENTVDFSSIRSERTSDSSSSIQNLIAAAQAKRKQAQMQPLSAGSHNFSLLTTTGAQGKSPSPPSAQLLVPGSLTQGELLGSHKQENSASPSHRTELTASQNLFDTDDIEDRRVSSNRQPGGSLSGGTEAAVARDAFEGMIETLSRTKESIGRATRHAIDCAKLGIATEIVDLLIHKLENETSLHRKVDLFFLIDSITQCSHSQKGIAGASYIPIVQAALPRLLGGAAPRGAGAPENRRQCLKVLRLWRDRRILPESVLRHYMDDLRASNDDTTTIPTFRRPSRAERAVDDPIREMEDMFVDEYGSNAAFHLPGLKLSRMFDADDDEEEDNYMAFPTLPSKVSVEASPDDVSGAADATPSDRRHCILEDVDGELEMEDVSGHPKDSAVHAPPERESVQQEPQGTSEPVNWVESPPFPEGSPPLPLDSPPPLPPLPSSPPPSPLLPPLPLSPSPPPPPPPSLPPPPPSDPPPPPSHPPPPPLEPPPPPPQPPLLPSELPLHSQPAALPSMPPTFISQTPVPPQLPVPSQSLFQSLPHVVYQAPLPRDYSGQYVSASQQYQHGPPYPPQQPSVNVLAPQNASTQYTFVKPTFQHPPQHTYSQQYSYLPTDSRRQFGSEDPWAASSSEFSSDKQSGAWMNGVRGPPSGEAYSQEGYFRPQFERPPPPPSNSLGFQVTPTKNPAAASVSGQAGSVVVPSRPDMSALNGWRPT